MPNQLRTIKDVFRSGQHSYWHYGRLPINRIAATAGSGILPLDCSVQAIRREIERWATLLQGRPAWSLSRRTSASSVRRPLAYAAFGGIICSSEEVARAASFLACRTTAQKLS